MEKTQNKTRIFKYIRETESQLRNVRDISLTQVEASWNVQIWTLAKGVDSTNTELVAGLFRKVGNGNLCCVDGLSSVASLPRLSANLPPVHDVALDRHRAVTVRRRPLDGDG